jgi:hypothetical protein
MTSRMSYTELNYSARHVDLVETVFSYIIVPESNMASTRSSEARLSSFLGSFVFFCSAILRHNMLPSNCHLMAFVRCLPKKPGRCALEILPHDAVFSSSRQFSF